MIWPRSLQSTLAASWDKLKIVLELEEVRLCNIIVFFLTFLELKFMPINHSETCTYSVGFI